VAMIQTDDRTGRPRTLRPARLHLSFVSLTNPAACRAPGLQELASASRPAIHHQPLRILALRPSYSGSVPPFLLFDRLLTNPRRRTRHSFIAHGLARPARPPYLDILGRDGPGAGRWGQTEQRMLLFSSGRFSFVGCAPARKSALDGQGGQHGKFTTTAHRRAGLGGSRTDIARSLNGATASPLYPFSSAVRRAIACIAT
jgi:hypothetical protein